MERAANGSVSVWSAFRFFPVPRCTQTIGAPVAVDDVAVRIAHSETVCHPRRSLQAADHGDDVYLSGRAILFFVVIPGRWVDFSAGTIWLLVFWDGRSRLIHHH